MGSDRSSVAIVGSNRIGWSWSVVYAKGGHNVRIYDQDEGRRNEAVRNAEGALRLLARAGWLNEPVEDVAGRIVAVSSLAEACDGVMYVQESVSERLEVKRAVFAELDAVCPPEVILGSSTAALTMSEIAAEVRHPERCLVVHPTNPPHLLPLVELVPSPATSPAVLQRALELQIQVGQRPIVCKKEVTGFVLNRLQMALFQEAVYLAREGVASIEDIDACVTDGLGLRWAFLGPWMVEQTNAESIESHLRSLVTGPHREIIDDLARDLDGPDERDFSIATDGLAAMMGDRTSADMTAYRDEMVLRLRELRDGAPAERPIEDVNSLSGEPIDA